MQGFLWCLKHAVELKMLPGREGEMGKVFYLYC